MKLDVSINSGAALLLYLAAFFAVLAAAALFQPVERLFGESMLALTGAFSGYLVKRGHNNKVFSACNGGGPAEGKEG